MSANKKLRDKRLEHGYTQQRMAELLGYRFRSGYNQIEMGKNRPPLHVAMKIAEVLNCKIEEIFDSQESLSDI